MSEDKQEREGFDLTKVLTVSAGHLTHDIFTAFLPPVLPLVIVQTKNTEQLIKMNSFYKTVGVVCTTTATLLLGQGADLIGLALIYKLLPLSLIFSLVLIVNLES